MDQNKKQKSLSQFIKSQFLKRVVTKLLLSVSVFSLLFSHSTLLSFVHYFNFYFSTLPFKLFSHTLDKNWTFLLCNGLLVFLAKYSGLFSLSSSSPSNKYNYNLNETFKNYEDDSQPQMTNMETIHDHHQVPLLEKEAELESTQTHQKRIAMQQENENKESETEAENSTEEKNHEEKEEEERGVVLEEDNAEPEPESSFFIEEIDEEEEEEEEEEEGNGKLSNEELNKKFDDFIRKMKEELRIEARQQLIMV